jgi:S-sulfosulfanyl-L-cysteine sulfohydrolase
LRVNGADVEDEQRYTIAACERAGEPIDVICRHRGSHDARVLPITVHQALHAYFKAHPVIAPRRDGRERALDLPERVFSQDAVLSSIDLGRALTTPSGLPPG